MNDDNFMWIFGSALVLVYVVVVWSWWRSIVRRRERRTGHENAFVSVLLGAVRNSSVQSLGEVLDLYLAHFKEEKLVTHIRLHLSQLLRHAILAVARDKPLMTSDLKQTLPFLRTCLSENKEFVRQEEVIIPFSGTPSPERQLLQDVMELTTSDREIVRTKLTEIARAVTARHDTVRQLGDEGRRSLKWAKWGLVGTVFFSVISILLGVWAVLR